MAVFKVEYHLTREDLVLTLAGWAVTQSVLPSTSPKSLLALKARQIVQERLVSFGREATEGHEVYDDEIGNQAQSWAEEVVTACWPSLK